MMQQDKQVVNRIGDHPDSNRPTQTTYYSFFIPVKAQLQLHLDQQLTWDRIHATLYSRTIRLSHGNFYDNVSTVIVIGLHQVNDVRIQHVTNTYSDDHPCLFQPSISYIQPELHSQ